MKTLLSTAAIAFVLVAGPAYARDVWTTLADTAPRSVFDDIRDTAPRSLFDQIGASAPRSKEGSKDLVGELQPTFEGLRDSAP